MSESLLRVIPADPEFRPSSFAAASAEAFLRGLLPVAGTTLTLRSTDGKTHAYRRAEPWCSRERIDYQPPK
jgi:hypothetical protein